MKLTTVRDKDIHDIKRGEYQIITDSNAYWIRVENRKLFDAPPVLKEFIRLPLFVLFRAIKQVEGAFQVRKISGQREVMYGFQSTYNGSFDGGADVLGDSQHPNGSCGGSSSG